MRAIWLCGMLLLAATPAFGQPASDPDARIKQMRAQVPCRNVTKIPLRGPDGRVGEVETGPYPYLDPSGNLIIYPGETITLALAKDGTGMPRLLKFADAKGAQQFAQPSANDATLEFQFSQMDGKTDMMLMVSNATSAVIKYDAVMSAVSDRGIDRVGTSTCPVNPPSSGQAAFFNTESWQHPIMRMIIRNIRPLAASASRACE